MKTLPFSPPAHTFVSGSQYGANTGSELQISFAIGSLTNRRNRALAPNLFFLSISFNDVLILPHPVTTALASFSNVLPGSSSFHGRQIGLTNDFDGSSS